MQDECSGLLSTAVAPRLNWARLAWLVACMLTARMQGKIPAQMAFSFRAAGVATTTVFRERLGQTSKVLGHCYCIAQQAYQACTCPGQALLLCYRHTQGKLPCCNMVAQNCRLPLHL
jgi:hypothetical protein